MGSNVEWLLAAKSTRWNPGAALRIYFLSCRFNKLRIDAEGHSNARLIDTSGNGDTKFQVDYQRRCDLDSRTVLCVDDIPQTLALRKATLESHGYRVKIVSSA